MPGDSRLRLHAGLLAAAAAGAVFSFWVRGYDPEGTNAVFQIPLLKARLDPELYSRDYLAASYASYRSLLWLALTDAAKLAGLGAALLSGYIGQLLLFHYAAALLVRRFTGGTGWPMVLTLILALAPKPVVGGSHYYFSQVSHAAWSVPFLLLAIQAMGSCGRWSLPAGAVLWSAGAWFHLPNAIYILPALALFAGARAWQARRDSREKGNRFLRGGIAAALLALVMVAPLGYPLLAQGRSADPLPPDLFRTLSFGFTQMHIYWDRNFLADPQVRSQFLAQTLLFGTVLMLAARTGAFARAYAAGYIGLAVPLAAAYVSTELLRSVELGRFMWMRVGDFLLLLGLVPALSLAAAWWRAPEEMKLPAVGLPVYFAVLVAAMGGVLTWWAPALCLVALALAGRWERGRRLEGGSVRLLSWSRAACALGGFLAFVWSAGSLQGRSLETVSPVHEDWRRVQEWARTSTRKDALFLTPFQIPGWRSGSERATFLELRDRAAVVLDARVAREHLRRSEILGVVSLIPGPGEADPVASYFRLQDSDLRRLAASSGINYVVFFRNQPSGFPEAYRNDSFRVLAVAGD